MRRAPQKPNDTAKHAEALRSLLDRFAAPVEVRLGPDHPLPAAPAERLTEVLREIDETVLPRRLTLLADGQEIGNLNISNRRLVGLSGANDAADEAETDLDAAGCAALLLNLCMYKGALTWCMSHRPPDYQDSSINCSAEQLRTALAIAPDRDDISRLSDLAKSQALSMLHWEDAKSVGKSSGATELHDLLQGYRTAFQAATSCEGTPKFEDRRTKGHVVELAADLSLLIAQSNERGCAFILPTKDALRTIASWQVARAAMGRTKDR